MSFLSGPIENQGLRYLIFKRGNVLADPDC